MPSYYLDLSDEDEDEKRYSTVDRYFSLMPTISDAVAKEEEEDISSVSDTDSSMSEDLLTETEDDASVDLDEDESDDEYDHIEGEEEYEKFKHTLIDFIVDEMVEAVEDEERSSPVKRRRIEE
jgi:hypothetical protein